MYFLLGTPACSLLISYIRPPYRKLLYVFCKGSCLLEEDVSCTRVTHLGTVNFVLEVFQVAQVPDRTSPCLREHKSSVHAHPAPGSLAQHIWAVPPNPWHPEQHRALLKPSQVFSPNRREPVLNPRLAFCCINPVTSALPLAGKEPPGAPSGYLFARIWSQRASWADSEPQATPRYGI